MAISSSTFADMAAYIFRPGKQVLPFIGKEKWLSRIRLLEDRFAGVGLITQFGQVFLYYFDKDVSAK